jgi:hypothetical protein
MILVFQAVQLLAGTRRMESVGGPLSSTRTLGRAFFLVMDVFGGAIYLSNTDTPGSG